MNNLHLFQKYICSQRSKISLFFLSGVKTFMFFYGMWYATRSLWTSLETWAWSKLDCVGFAPESVLLMILLLRLQHCPAHRDSKSFPFLSRVSTSVVTCVCVCTQSCLTLCNPIDCSSPSSCVHRIFQSRILWSLLSKSTISYSRGSSPPRKWNCVSCISAACTGRRICYH